MTGKEKCEFLKEIRKTMAKKNGIEYDPLECHHEGDCRGTCPYCENEAMILLAELRKKERDGQPIEIDTDTIKTLELLSGISIDTKENRDTEMGFLPVNLLSHLNDEPEREPDIVWNMDDEENPQFSQRLTEEKRRLEEEREREKRDKMIYKQKKSLWYKLTMPFRKCVIFMGELEDE